MLEGFKQNLFLTWMRRASHDNRIILLQAQLQTILVQILRRNLGIGLVKFRVAGNKDFAAVCAEMRNIIGINARLHAKTRNGIEHVVPDTVEIFIAFHGFFRDTAINHHYRDMTFTDSTQKVRPQLRFYRHEHAGVNAFDQRFCYKRQVQRKVDNRICFRDNLLRHVITANSEGGNQHGTVRHFLANLLNKRTCCHNLAYGRAMNPDAVLADNLGDFLFIYTAQALLKAQAEALFCKQTIGIIRDDEKHQHY